ncbi:ABC transporter substrate-binding protein [Methylomonas sp. SURF-2]|uniref:ABC transporter substrate-binding protein n=1 Tax=Methylomonas subterranea TaxID=2952225 RepID=A0ABT1THR5_9GAMM|nr:ABC transporter substrate-binding protein [Methylomonas sp. SURF-2]MCQ8104970.1 ABC transporter substrate-binding protein [Methylomonas sp. SURF-2]
MTSKILLFAFFTLFSNLASGAEPTSIRLGVLASGTLAWELAAMRNQNLLENAGFKLETVELANQQAGKVALQAGSVDMIVSDWIWVSAMRAQGGDFTFYPYSTSAGGLLVAADSGIKTLADLQGKKLGIAGGELDKNWSLLQALGLQHGLDLNKSVEKVYAAPPLLNQQLSSGRIDALLTYWQFAARLEARGYRQLLSGEDIIRQLGITEAVPSLGYVFRRNWADQHRADLQQFMQAAQTAKRSLCDSDNAWRQIANLTETDDTNTQNQLRNRYCQGHIKQWGDAGHKAAEQIYRLLHQLSDNKLTGKSEQLQPGTFWSAD